MNLRFLKAGCLVLVLTVLASGAAVAAPGARSTSTPASPTSNPDPVADCPVGLVCYTLDEEARAQIAEAAKQNHLEAVEAELARLKWRRRVGFFAEGRLGSTMNGPTHGAVIVGAHLYGFSAGVGVFDHGDGFVAGGEVAFRYSW